MRALGLVLAGGQSRRMGTDKALLTLGGETLLARALRRLGPQVEGLAISANMPINAEYPILADEVADQGPLGGVLAGLVHAKSQGFSHLVTVAVDTPFFPDDLAARLAASGPRVVVRGHPVFALWPVVVENDLRQALADGERKLFHVMARLNFTELALPDAAFFNVNTRDDLAEAERRFI
jgi:molybdopterin-guanine dinucleotide biosynthesis protein A